MARDKEQARAYQSRWYQRNRIRHAAAGKEWRRKNPDRASAITKRYRQTEQGKATHAASIGRQKQRHPDRVKARQIVANELQAGRLTRQSCWCGGAKSQAHHEDYSKPLDVEWLCWIHHQEADRAKQKKTD